MLTRTPGHALRSFVKTLWATTAAPATPPIAADRERVLPTGLMHCAFRLSGRPLRLVDGNRDCRGHAVGHSIVGGARLAPYVRDLGPARSVGVEFHPGAGEVLFGVPADELAGRHTPLDLLWGRTAEVTRERLADASSPEEQLDLLESVLAARLPRIRGLHPAVAHALERFTNTADVCTVVRQTGYSHRRFNAPFARAVGLTPKRYCRVRRFQQVIRRIVAKPDPSWIEIAADCGYSDQSHFNREFREFAGITPGEYCSIAPTRPHHLPIGR